MALAFYDNFDRSDGPVGADWVIVGGTPVISGNTLRLGAQHFIQPADAPTSVDQGIRLKVLPPQTFPRGGYLRFRVSTDRATYYQLTVTLSATVISVYVYVVVDGTSTGVADITRPYTYNMPIDIRASVSNDLIRVWIDEQMWLTCREESLITAGKWEIGSGSNYWYVDEAWFYDYPAPGFTYTIEEPETQGDPFTITLHNAGAPWTVGTPGSPTFTAAVGTISSQEVTAADTAVLLWLPGEVISSESLFDPLNDYQWQFDVGYPPSSLGAGGEGGGLTLYEHEQIEKLEAYLDDYQSGGGAISGLWVKLGAISILAGSAYTTGDGTAIGDLFDAVLDTTNGLAANKNVTDLIYALLDATTEQGGYTLESVQEAIRGASARDLTAVYNLIANLDVADQTDVTGILNAIAAIRTANLWTLDSVKTWIEAIDTGSNQDVLNELALIRTANNWSLGHIMDAIAGLDIVDPTTQLTDIHDHVIAIPTNPITSLQPALDAISGVRGTGNPDLAAVLSAVQSIPTNPITDLSSVISAISTLSGHLDDKIELVLDAIAAIVPGAGTPTAPVWPGLGNVTLGTPVAIDRTFTSSATCHGVIVAITGDSMARGTYDWGGVTQHYRAGYVSFATDRGDRADPQPFTFPSHVITVPNALQASGFIGKARAGVTGSVTPWTINPA